MSIDQLDMALVSRTQCEWVGVLALLEKVLGIDAAAMLATERVVCVTYKEQRTHVKRSTSSGLMSR